MRCRSPRASAVLRLPPIIGEAVAAGEDTVWNGCLGLKSVRHVNG